MLMKHIIFVDAAHIGLFLFRGFIFENKNREICFGIFLDDHQNPLIWFEANEADLVSLHLDESLIQLISNKTISSKEQRTKNFKSFLSFVKESERVASKMVFKGKTIEYLSKSQELVRIKNKYVNKID